MTIEPIQGRIEGDSRGFESAVDRAVKAIGKFDKSIESVAARAGKAFDKPGSGLGRFTKQGGSATKTVASLNAASLNSSANFTKLAGVLGSAGLAIAGVAKVAGLATDAIGALGRATLATGEAIVGLAERGGRVNAVSSSFQALAAQAGQSSGELLSAIRSGSQGLITGVESMTAANRLLAAQIPVTGERLGQLTSAAIKAGSALGLNANESVQRLTQGLSKLEGESLDEIGIRVSATEAYKNYAAGLGIAVSELTAYQRQIAFTVAVEEQLLERTAALGDDVLPSFAGSLARLSVAGSDTVDSLASIIAGSEGLASITDVIGGAVKEAGRFIEANKEGIGSFFDTIGKRVSGVINAIGGFKGALNIATTFAGGALTTLGNLISSLRLPISFIGTRLKVFGNLVKVNIGAIGTVATAAGSVFATAAKFIVEKIAALAGKFTEFGEFIKKVPGAASFGKAIADGAAKAEKGLLSTAEAIGDFSGFLKDARAASIDLFKDGLGGIKETIGDFGALNDRVDSFGKKLRSAGAATIGFGLGGATQSTGPIDAFAANASQFAESAGSSPIDSVIRATSATEEKRSEIIRKIGADRVLAELENGRVLQSVAERSGLSAAEAIGRGFASQASQFQSVGRAAGTSIISSLAAGITPGLMREFQGPLGARQALESQRAADNFLRSQFGFSGGNFGLSSGQTAIRVLGFADGGVVPGVGRGDKVPALLEPGERVLSNEELDDGLMGSINVTINFSGNPDRSQARGLVDEVIREIDRRRSLGQGGRR